MYTLPHAGVPRRVPRGSKSGRGDAAALASKPPHDENKSHQNRHEDRIEKPQLPEAEAGVDPPSEESQEESGPRRSRHPHKGEDCP